MAKRRIVFLLATFGFWLATTTCAEAEAPAVTTYGNKNVEAPLQLAEFSFLVGKWQGSGKTRLANGSYADFTGVTWIGRYVLDGMAIADEFHASTADGKAYLGISLRQFDTRHNSWIVEYLNVSNSFLRRQVNPRSGSVSHHADGPVVTSANGQAQFRESYRVTDKDHFTYSADTSRDGGRTWDPTSIQISMVRAE
jgi:Protein of unknown function (DUF1579)